MSRDLTPDDPASVFALGVHTLSAGFPKAWIDMEQRVFCAGAISERVSRSTLVCGKQILLLALGFTLSLWHRMSPG